MEEKQLKYYKMHHDLQEQIRLGELRSGDRVPSENQLAAAYQVSRQTVRKALAILEQEGYIYAVHGKGTFVSERVRPEHKSHNIAVVTTYLSDYIFPRVIQGIDEVLTAQGYSILLKNTRNSRSQEARCLEELLQKDIDGVIIEPSKSQISCRHLHLYERLEEYGIPYVFIQGCFDQMEDKPQVLMDDCRGGHLITKYLLDTGHRDIAGVFKADDIQGQNRHRGYVQALQEAGVLYDPDKVIWFHTEDRKVHPQEGIRRLISKGTRLDSVVCYNDQIAMQVIPLDVFKMLEAVANGVRQRAVVIVICHQRNQSRRKDDASGAHFHRRPGLVALHFGQRLTAEFHNRVVAGARQAHADGGHVVERAA